MEPEVTSRSVGVSGGLKAMTEKFFDMVKSCVSDHTLGIFREVSDLKGVWNGNRVRGGKRFGDRDGKIPIGDGNRWFGNVGNVRIYL